MHFFMGSIGTMFLKEGYGLQFLWVKSYKEKDKLISDEFSKMKIMHIITNWMAGLLFKIKIKLLITFNCVTVLKNFYNILKIHCSELLFQLSFQNHHQNLNFKV